MKKTRKTSHVQAEKFSRAQALHRQGKFAQARSLYLSILTLEPDHADALHFLGFLSYQTGDSKTALELIRRSVRLDPANVTFINNLGNVLLDERQLEEAERCYRTVIEHQPRQASNYSNLCVVLRHQGRLAEAIEAGRTSVRLDPGSAMAWYTLGNAYRVAGRGRKAIDALGHSVGLDPTMSIAHDALCQVTYELESRRFLRGRGWKKTIRAYQQWLDVEPNQPLARFMVQALQERSTVTRAPDDVIRAQFDHMAASFERRLKNLDYRVPALIDRMLQKTLGKGDGDREVLDGGCGTGLCAATLKRYATRLTGVDLSVEMIRQAETLGLYDELVEQELTAFVHEHQNSFDLVVYADTLCYFGDLRDVITATARALRNGGYAAFTLEEQPSGPSYWLNPNGRYTHNRDYVERVLADCGLEVLECSHESLRMEAKREVPGLLMLIRKPAGHDPTSRSAHSR